MIKKEDLKEFEKAYQTALESKKETFSYKGQKVLVSYAKYLIEFLKM